MNLRFFVLLLPVVLASWLGRAQPGGAAVWLKGSVWEGTNRQPAVGAKILLSPAPAGSLLYTDADGLFEIRLAPGRYELTVQHRSRNTAPLVLTLTGDTTLRLQAAGAENALQEVVVTSQSNRSRLSSTQVGLEIVDRKTALQLPAILGEVDMLKVLQLKPGVKSSGEGSSGLSVRGGGVDQNLFLFDGTPVYNPAHLFGFFSTFNIDAVRDVQLYKAGFPAAFSGRLSSIVDVRSLGGTDSALSVSGGIGLISSRVNVQGNLLAKNKRGKKLTYNVAARRTYADVFTRLLNKAKEGDPDWTVIPDYYFYDANARLDYQPNERDHLFASLYYGRDVFGLTRGPIGASFTWGNTAASLHWNRRLTDRLSSELSAHASDYRYSLATGFGQYDFRLGSGVREYALKHRLLYRTDRHALTAGWSVSATGYRVSRLDVSDDQGGTMATGETPQGVETGLYVADDWDLTPRLRINGGLRFSSFHNGVTYAGVEPRFSLRQLLGADWAVKASYARMRQYQHLVTSSGASLPTDIWYPSTARIRPEVSDQVSLGMSKTVGSQWLFTAEAYYKWMRQLVDFKTGANLVVNSALENEFVFGTGDGYGAELTVEKTAGKLRGWIGYTWAITTRQFDSVNGGRRYFPRFDRRHELSVVAMYPLTSRLNLSGSWTFYTGNAVSLPTSRIAYVGAPGTTNASSLYSVTPLYPERGNYRMPSYHRLDLGLVYKLRPRRGSADLTISAYNAYNRLNPYFISFEEAKGPANATPPVVNVPRTLQAKVITLFPIIPSITYNFRF